MPLWLRTAIRVALLISLVSMASVLGLIVARELIDYDSLRASSDSLGTFVQTLGGIYAVLLGFIVLVVWGQFNDARSFVDREANCLVELHRTASGLPPDTRDVIQSGLESYVDAVLADEWRAMGKHDQAVIERVGRRLDRVWSAVHSCMPDNHCQQVMYAEVLSRFNSLMELRTSRLNTAGARIPIAMNVLLYTGALIMIGSVYLMAFDRFWLHATVTAALAGAVANILLLIRDLDDAFAGDWQVERGPLERARRSFERSATISA